MFEKIVVGIDGREGGRDALGLAAAIAGHDTDVELVHVYPYAEAMGFENAQAIERELALGSQGLLDEAAAAVDRPVRTFVVGSSSPGFGLHTRAERTQADLVVIGTSRRPLASRLLVGDTARALLRGAPCAVALAPPGGIRSHDDLRVVVGYDGRPESTAALELAQRLIAEHGARLSVVTAVHGPEAFSPVDAYTFDFDRVAGDVLRSAQERLAALGGDLATEARMGTPAQVLGDASGDADILVVGSRGYGPLRRLVLGSTSEALIGRTRCALVVVPRVATER